MTSRITYLLCAALMSGCVTAGQHFRSLSSEKQVAEIQTDLGKLGHYKGTIDGVYGKRTEQAIRDFQRANRMTEDGKVSESLYIQTGLAVSRQAKLDLNDRPEVSQPSGSQSATSTVAGQQTGNHNSAESRACASADWTGVVKNVADLFECDTTRAIGSLSSGRVIVFNVGNVSFRGGKFIADMTAVPTYAQTAQKNNSKSGNFSWNNWFDTVHGYSSPYMISCTFSVEKGSTLKPGASMQVRANLVNYSERRASLNCS